MGDHLEDGFLMLSKEACAQVGQAAQTLAGLYLLVDDRRGETFASRAVIASRACRPESNLDRDLKKLELYEWIKNRGRKKWNPKIHKVRRTNTLMLTEKAYHCRKPFLRLPTWACPFCPTWGERVVFAAVVTRHLLLKAVGADVNHGRESYPIKKLAEDTGLAENSVLEAKRRLMASSMIIVETGETYQDEHGRWRGFADEIWLNEDLLLPIPKPHRKSEEGKKGLDTLSAPQKWRTTTLKSEEAPTAKVNTPHRKSEDRNDQDLLKPLLKSISYKHTLAAQGRGVFENKEEEEICEVKKTRMMPTQAEIDERVRNYQAYMRQLDQEADAIFGPTANGKGN
jgi:hypothetical protein